MQVAVYLGANQGRKALYKEVTEKLGAWIGKNGCTLVYGGSDVGLMGILAHQVKASGGRIKGVVPSFFDDLTYKDLDEKVLVRTMEERKAAMAKDTSLFIALPGGLGTLEESADILSQTRIGIYNAPFVFINANGYYDNLKKQINKMVEEGFLEEEVFSHVFFIDSEEELNKIASKASQGLFKGHYLKQ